MRIHIYYVYILSNSNHTVLYTGVTNDLERRCFEHLKKVHRGFTQKYNIDQLLYYEILDDINIAISREKQIKGYSRSKKNGLISKFNKNWVNLYINGKINKPHPG